MSATTLDRPLADAISVDRWMYVAIAGLLCLTAVVGFGPRSAAILTGVRPNPPLVVHIHAAFMAVWLGLLFAQSLLAATGRLGWHRTLGITSFVVAPSLVAAMIAVTIWRFDQRVELNQAMAGANTLMSQFRSIFCFSLFFLWAVLVRRKDTDTHKRMMILATLLLLPAGIFRIEWLPTTMPGSYIAVHGYMLLLLAPALIYDIVRLGRIHRAYVWGLAIVAPWMIAIHFLWSTPWWTKTAMRLMGAA